MKRIGALVFILPLVVSLSACFGTISGDVADAPPAGSNRPTDQPKKEKAPSKEPAPDDTTLAFGQSYTWDDGVTLTVSKGKKFKPGKYSAGGEKAEDYLKYSITVVNKSTKPLDLALTYITVQSDNKEAEQVFDSSNDLEGSPSTKLLKGRESEWDVGFGVANSRDVVMEIAIQDDFERPSLIYTSGG